MRLLTTALAAGAAAIGTLALAAATPSPLGPAPPSGTSLPKDQCILTHEMGNHSVVDQKTLLVDAFGRSKGVYRFTMNTGCLRSATSSDRISIRQVGGGKICAPKDLELTARSGVCDVDSIVKLSPEEAAALPRKLKP